MIDGLRRDFPEVIALARRIPSPRFGQASPLWGVVAAFGAGFFVSAALVVVFTMTSRLLGAPTQWIGGVTTVGATATALTVAFTIGGRGALIVYAGIVISERLLALPGLMRFCLAIVSEFSGCSPISYLLALWPEALAIALAYWLVLVRWMGAKDGDGNPVLEAAGALALTQGAAVAVLGAVLLSASTTQAGLLLLVSAVAGGIACGLVVLRRIPESARWRSLAIIAVAVMGVWLLVSVPALADQVGIGGAVAIGGLNLIGFASPIVELGTAALVLYMAAARNAAAATEVV